MDFYFTYNIKLLLFEERERNLYENSLDARLFDSRFNIV